MWSTAREIAAGDVVIAWMTRDLIQPLVITPGGELNSKYGYYRHDELVGIPYGSKVRSRNGKGFIHLLRPTPELWTLALPHRTQILYLADIAYVTAWLDIRPGSKVIEAGTGSGSFSHSVARTIGPRGHLWSYEFHETRAAKAREEFTRHGMDDIVTLTHRNVCKDGFTVEDTVDAVFLDLPAPWDAIEHAKKALRKDRATRICCFSPCIEQVLRTVSALNDAGFTEITMYETLLRPHMVEAPPPLEKVGSVSARLQVADARREEKRLRQIANARLGIERRAAKRKADEDADEEGQEGKRARTGGEATEAGGDELVSPEDQARDEAEALAEMHAAPAPPAASTPAAQAVHDAASLEVETAEPRKITLSKAFPDVRGHTSYLTFAVLLPVAASGKPEGSAIAATEAQVCTVTDPHCGMR
ncbi:tRNA methyltransferase complex GCD14 subunit [Trametes versicolor FP-101664 SS1]|uniref:tRNA methyltransferase complex GCD14 subunit n=1 Tax=Trametes versicolor (strain FP-101664) TaxID=717944 RepID=UPI00046214D8|nr:tRNA methyltransferase complex GCD14 subunit [Trametes versicolor FP-101664 SS1]EIW59167.1 tRNA methyltransferase complex GCD14 subunit [Trametes versicolor FP-101664 SS1]